MISLCADAIIKAESASKKRELEEAAGTWDGKSNDYYHHKIFGIIRFSATHISWIAYITILISYHLRGTTCCFEVCRESGTIR